MDAKEVADEVNRRVTLNDQMNSIKQLTELEREIAKLNKRRDNLLRYIGRLDEKLEPVSVQP